MNTAWEQLKQDHRFYIGTDHEHKITHELESLIDHKPACRALLEAQNEGLAAPDLSITGLLFGKMYSVMTMGMYETIVKYGLVIDASPENIGIECLEKNKMNYVIREEAVASIEDLTEEEVKDRIRRFITENLQPLFQTIAKASNCKSTHMRSIVSHNLHQRSLAFAEEHPEKKDFAEKVLHWFTSEELFEDGTVNPLHFEFRFFEKENGKGTYVRRHCCMKYMLHQGNKKNCCPTCPLISDEERADRL
ncbi:UNVERIFIED_CONTAM: hypothetical protein N8J90_00100 [Halobacillus marinus]|uniref:IucA/IucC family C-terminal-domain containing protein n=1 Tax=Bacillaceae TaxID=186817 RepID=UPI0002A4F81F|nr:MULTISPECIES: IucA/IucC family C-terminal-domain containing protein [Bacillaceae]ELK45644.1 hypothetical protein D479_13922 [Halobacillus sp. BAB-2008]QHT46171.1 hypothetical protein M662_06595 [Bacillus sp. SB49]